MGGGKVSQTPPLAEVGALLAVVKRALRLAFLSAAGGFLAVTAASLATPADAFYAVELALEHLGPLSGLARHIRSAPSTIRSIAAEGPGSPGGTVVVEGIEVDLDRTVNPTDRVVEGRLYSQVLGQARTYWVYLPPGYESSARRYPTLYLLHGMSQDHKWWIQVARLDRIVTTMVRSGKIRPAIIVMPNGNSDETDITTTTLYDNRCETGLDLVARFFNRLGRLVANLDIYKVSCRGDFERYLVEELVPEIDARYRTTGERYVGGFSLGGRGALQLVAVHPEVFVGAFGLSGNYDYLRRAVRRGRATGLREARIFIGAGDKDQRGLYGSMATYLFHRDLASLGISHAYCVYPGAHNDRGWVRALPAALAYLLSPSPQATAPGKPCLGGDPSGTAEPRLGFLPP